MRQAMARDFASPGVHRKGSAGFSVSVPVKPMVGGKADYAKHRGCSPAYVSKLIRQGKLAEPALMADGRVNFVLADQMVGRGSEDESQPGLPSQLGPNYAAERARREAAEAAQAEIKLAVMRREMIRVEHLDQSAASVFGRALARFSQAWPDVSVALAAMTDPGAIAERLAATQHAVMGEINKEFLDDAARRSGS